jgi:hypothetical protein
MTTVKLKINYAKYIKILQWCEERFGRGLLHDDAKIKLSNEVKWSNEYNDGVALFNLYSACDAVVFRLTWGCDNDE